MAFESTWGFNPDEASKAQGLAGSETEADDFEYSAAEERAARIPGNEDAQIYELRRMFRL